MIDTRPAGKVRSGGRAAEDTAVVRRARLRLAGWYTATLALIVIGFSVALYTALAAELPGGPDDKPDPGSAQQAERQTADLALNRLRLLLIGGNAILLIGAAAGAYALAGTTLRPIARAVARERRFAADASHELRTPLTIMRGALDVALRRERTSAEYRETLRELGEEVETLTALVEALLQLARGQAMQVVNACDLRTLLVEVVREAAPLAAARGSSLTLAPGETRCVRADATALRRALTNLVRNALQHTPHGTVITVTIRARHGAVDVLVSDNGPGIAPSERERIFQPFYRTQTTGSDGAGLGLALTRELIAAQGGAIGVEETPGGGATFRVRLPCHGPAPDAPPG